MALSKEQALAGIAKARIEGLEPVGTPWGGEMLMAKLSPDELVESGFFDIEATDDPSELARAIAPVLSFVLRDDAGERVFVADDEVAVLRTADTATLEDIFDKWAHHQGLRKKRKTGDAEDPPASA